MSITDTTERLAGSSLMKAIVNLFIIVLVPIVGWAATTLIGLQSDVRIMQNQFAGFNTDRYRSDEARRDLQYRDLRIDTIEKQLTLRIDQLEQREVALEHDVRTTKTTVEEIAPPLRKPPR